MGIIRVKVFHKQRQFLRALKDPELEQILYGGARGGGKSEVVRMALIMRALQYPGTKHVIFRTVESDVIKQHKLPLEEMLNEWGIPHQWNDKNKIFTLSGGSQIILAFANSVAHTKKYQGLEYLTVVFDEATQFREIIYDRICGSLRVATDAPTTVKKILAANPGDIGHAWVKRRFVDEKTRDDHTLFIKSVLRDNIVLMKRDPGYGERLTRGLPDHLKQQWLEGDWDAQEGQYFNIPPGAIREWHFGPQGIQWCQWYAGADWGYSPSAFAVVWAATWKDIHGGNHMHIYRCLKQQRLDMDEQAKAAMEIEGQNGIYPKIRYADPATGKRLEAESDQQAKTVRRVWSKFGFVTQPAKRHSRVAGWGLIRMLLKPCYGLDTDKPHGILTIDPSCATLIAELKDAVFETSNGVITGDDIDESCEDHCFIAGTMITTERGQVPIEQVTTSDRVLTRQGYRQVQDAWQTNPSAKTFLLTLSDGKVLQGTGNHPIFVEGRGFVPLDSLRCKDSVLSYSPETSTCIPNIVPVRVLSVAEATVSPVYNLTVEGVPEYFANGILVHNCLDSLRYVCRMKYGLEFVQEPIAAYQPRLSLVKVA